MLRLTHATPLLLGMLAVTACPGTETPADTEGTSTGETTEDPSVGPTTAPLTTTVDPDSTSTATPETESGMDTSTGELVCEPGCGAGECCVEGYCFTAHEPVCNPGCGLFEACLCPEGSDPCTCLGECVGCGTAAAAYDPCFDVECPAGSFCVVDDPAEPTLGWCAEQGCGTDDCACPLGAGGATALPACGVFDGDEGTGSCFLDCDADGAVCPDGMTCRTMGDVRACLWEQIVALPGFGDCADNPLSTCQVGEDSCLIDEAETAAACSETGCADAGDCPGAPDTGDAPVTCGDLGGGNTCYLDCAGGQTCGDGTVCTPVGGGMACLWVDDGFLLDEDFEQGAFRPSWSVIDVDGNTPAAATEFVSAAYVVADVWEEGVNFGAYSTSWYSPAGASDDWLVTPQIDLGPASILSWEGWAPDQGYPDGYEVYVSTTGATVPELMADPPVFTIADEGEPFIPHMVDLALAGYMNQAVYIAFRNNSDDENLLVIDNVRVTE
jgi:hypothetical protein